MEGENLARGLFQPAPRPVALDGIAHLLGGGKASSGRAFCRITRHHLHDKAGTGGRAAVTRTQKIAPYADARGAIWILQRFQSVAIRPTGACGHAHGGGRQSDGQPWWPYGRGNRDAGRGRFWTAGRYVSRHWLLKRQTRRSHHVRALRARDGAKPGENRAAVTTGAGGRCQAGAGNSGSSIRKATFSCASLYWQADSTPHPPKDIP